MARILRCLICFSVVMASAQTQRGYFFQNTYQAKVAYPTEFPSEKPQSRTLEQYTYTNPPTSEHSVRSEDRRRRTETWIPQDQKFENGTYKFTNRIQLNKRGALEETISSPNDRVVFPGPTSKGFQEPQVPATCKKKGYCDSVSNYPTDYVKKLVAEHGHTVTFQMDALDDEVQIAQRLGGTGADQEIELCNFTEQIMMPTRGEDKDGKWHTVANPPDNPVQGFRVETCNETGAGCNSIASIQDGYKASCKQKFSYRMMVTVKDEKLEQRALKLPSCCSCVITVNPFKK